MKYEYDTVLIGHSRGILVKGVVETLNKKGAEGWKVVTMNREQILLMREVKS